MEYRRKCEKRNGELTGNWLFGSPFHIPSTWRNHMSHTLIHFQLSSPLFHQRVHSVQVHVRAGADSEHEHRWANGCCVEYTCVYTLCGRVESWRGVLARGAGWRLSIAGGIRDRRGGRAEGTAREQWLALQVWDTSGARLGMWARSVSACARS